jgi:hypothetical protein
VSKVRLRFRFDLTNELKKKLKISEFFRTLIEHKKKSFHISNSIHNSCKFLLHRYLCLFNLILLSEQFRIYTHVGKANNNFYSMQIPRVQKQTQKSK